MRMEEKVPDKSKKEKPASRHAVEIVEQIHEKYHDTLLRLARSLLIRRHDIRIPKELPEDMMQIVYGALLHAENPDIYLTEDESHNLKYLRILLRSKIDDHLKGLQAQKRMPPGGFVSLTEVEGENKKEKYFVEEDNSSEKIEEKLDNALRRLEKDDAVTAKVIEDIYIHNKTAKQIGAELGLAEKTIKVKEEQGLIKLGHAIEKNSTTLKGEVLGAMTVRGMMERIEKREKIRGRGVKKQ